MPKIQERALIVDQRGVAERTYLMRLQSPKIALEARPGQFAMLRVSQGLDPLLRRPISFHRVFPEGGMIEFLYRVVGKGTLCLSKCLPGSRIDLIGPLGNGFSLPDRNDPSPVAFVAGGIGIAPLCDLLVRLAPGGPDPSSPSRVHLFYGARTASEFLPAAWFGQRGIPVHWSTDDGSFGYRGYVTRMLAEFSDAEDFRPGLIYACGPLDMQFHVAKWVLARNIPAQLSLESLMACGIGACLGCALPSAVPGDSAGDHYVHVCKDGPIFSAGAIQWQKMQTHRLAPPIFPCD